MWRHSKSLLSLNPPSKCYPHTIRASAGLRIEDVVVAVREVLSLRLQFSPSFVMVSLSLSLSSFFTDFPSFARLFMRFLCSSSRTISLLSVVSSVLSSKTINGGAYSAAGYLISERSSVSLKLLIGAWLFVRMNSVVGFGFGSGVMQTAAVLEVLHGAIGTLWLFVIWLEWMSYELIDWLILFEILKGIVPSGFLSPLMQWSGRTHFILAIVGQINEVFTLWSALLVSWEDVSAKLAVWFCFHIHLFQVQDSPWLAITLVAWCIGEVSLIDLHFSISLLLTIRQRNTSDSWNGPLAAVRVDWENFLGEWSPV